MNQSILDAIQQSIDVKGKILNDKKLVLQLDNISTKLIESYKQGGKLLIAGNGGSAADAQHFAAEIVGRYKEKRRGHPAIALTTDTSILTAWGNDYSFEDIFARQVSALGNAGDVLFLLSTSGNSKNLIEAAKTSQRKGITVIGLLGKNGGALFELCDHSFVVPSDDTPRIQETHIMCIHIFCDALDKYFATEEIKY